jgi:ATP synthase protein I
MLPELPKMLPHDARILRGAAIPTAVAGVVAIAIATVVAGGKGLLGALFSVVLVLAFFGFGQLALDRLTRDNPQIFMAAGLLVYTTQILLVGIVLAIFQGTTLFDTKVFAFTLLGCALIWTAGVVRAATKVKLLYVNPEAGVPPERPRVHDPERRS